jgi:hypothetical protein
MPDLSREEMLESARASAKRIADSSLNKTLAALEVMDVPELTVMLKWFEDAEKGCLFSGALKTPAMN